MNQHLISALTELFCLCVFTFIRNIIRIQAASSLPENNSCRAAYAPYKTQWKLPCDPVWAFYGSVHRGLAFNKLEI
jgi:hypothetical protein